jgi:carbonic anhydrase
MELDRPMDAEVRSRRLCELNVMAQVESVSRVAVVRNAWRRGQTLAIHGWIYDLADGLLRDLNISVATLSA